MYISPEWFIKLKSKIRARQKLELRIFAREQSTIVNENGPTIITHPDELERTVSQFYANQLELDKYARVMEALNELITFEEWMHTLRQLSLALWPFTFKLWNSFDQVEIRTIEISHYIDIRNHQERQIIQSATINY
ncbi:hypothetical protein RIR_jg32383.t1 [Rhizophagus irregularis DAOM 181602=DAOM 197198]|uniref:Uncharacterized protein n=1 Tax=Rhizophagus irregularis (strain DAOM 181602 / DAOM 197198 / MUCL 43194) TaxID=747089 RepID=U9UGA3_RHIID|nr:hypothetical protein RIR_jg32383.t1 [Rhizophagus irregularis DAOM 181602=DAOM 197198]